ncbi:flavin reductase family protein [Chloroflexota bacterium]
MKIEMKDLDRQQSHDLMGTSIAPLPIAFISTIGEDGTYNASPYSFVAPVSSKPPLVCISFGLRGGQKKDTLRNIEFSHDFVINVVDETLIEQAVRASAEYPAGVDEIEEVGLTAVNSEKVKAPRIAEARVSLECRLVQKLEMMNEFQEGSGLRAIVFGEVVLAHVKDEVWVDGKIDPRRLKAVGRTGTGIYCRTGDMFELKLS